MRIKVLMVCVLTSASIVQEASAAGISFEYFRDDYGGGSPRAAHGSFTFSDSLLGQTIHFDDLDSFNISFEPAVGGSTYDLAYTKTGSFSEYLYFGFNTYANTFVGTNIDGFTTYMTAIKPGYVEGFWIGINHSGYKLTGTDYVHGTQGFPIIITSIKALPALSIAPSGTNLVLSWPDLSSTAGFRLQESLSFATTNWSDVATTPILANGQKQVFVSPEAGQRFYRLQEP